MTPRVVLDTNILVSALKSPTGHPAAVLLLALRGHVLLCLSPAIMAEYAVVLRRPELKLDPHHVDATLLHLREVARLVSPTLTLTESSHEPDNRFYECAAAVSADFIVTGNIRHFKRGYRNTKIVTPRQLLDVLAVGETGA